MTLANAYEGHGMSRDADQAYQQAYELRAAQHGNAQRGK
jgi:hypothetical protein